MHLVPHALTPVLILVTAGLWTFLSLKLQPYRAGHDLPWPARRSVLESLVVVVVWTGTSVIYWKVFWWGMVWYATGAGFIWLLVTLYCGTALRQYLIDRSYRDRGL